MDEGNKLITWVLTFVLGLYETITWVVDFWSRDFLFG